MKKTWCQHITQGADGWVMLQDTVNPSVIQVLRTWKVCPICEAPRPTKANIRAATLQALMDNDQ